MPIDQIPEHETPQGSYPEGSQSAASRYAPWLIVISLVLAALIAGQIYTLHKLGSARGSFDTQQAKAQKMYVSQLSERLDTLERSNAQQLEALKVELDSTAKRMGSTGSALGRARGMVKKLEQQQSEQTDALKQEIARKADQQQLLALTQDVSLAKTDLDTTRKSLDSISKELGMTKTDFGTLIARNHDEIQELRKLGERDYMEFALERNRPQRLAGVSLILKKANIRRHRFNLVVVADDMETEKKDRTVNEPIFFYVAGSKKPYEVVVNKVERSRVVGYISTPKGAMQMASRSEGTARTQ